MSWNLGVIDHKPRNLGATDEKPKSFGAIDKKPQSGAVRTGLENRVYQQTLSAGMYAGIPPFTYPAAITVDSPFSP